MLNINYGCYLQNRNVKLCNLKNKKKILIRIKKQLTASRQKRKKKKLV